MNGLVNRMLSRPTATRLHLALILGVGTAACAPTATDARRPCPACKAQPTLESRSVTTPPAPRLKPPAIFQAHELLVSQLETRACDDIYGRFNAHMRKALSQEKTREVCHGLSKAGPFERIEVRKLSQRTGEFSLFGKGGEIHSSLTLDEAGAIAGLYFRPPPPPPAPVARTKTSLQLPFEGQWAVVWGGDNLTDNKHITHKNQQRAADLLVLDSTGKSYKGDGKKNSDYFAYGKKILAAAKGTVVTVIDGVPDNTPGVMNGYSALGNAVVIKHGEGEYSLYAHLSPGSIRVRPKTVVRAGQLLGLCGNSGNSSEAHLHFHLQDRADVATAIGVEPAFDKVELQQGASKSEPEGYTFRKGDRVAPR